MKTVLMHTKLIIISEQDVYKFTSLNLEQLICMLHVLGYQYVVMSSNNGPHLVRLNLWVNCKNKLYLLGSGLVFARQLDLHSNLIL